MKRLRWLLQRKRHLEIKVNLRVLWWFHVVHVVQNGWRVFTDTNGYLGKAENERFTVAGSRCCQNLHVFIWQTTLTKWCTKSVPHVQHECFSLIHPVVDLRRCRCHCCDRFIRNREFKQQRWQWQRQWQKTVVEMRKNIRAARPARTFNTFLWRSPQINRLQFLNLRP